jgi:hypothetical protein
VLPSQPTGVIGTVAEHAGISGSWCACVLCTSSTSREQERLGVACSASETFDVTETLVVPSML